MDANRFTIEQYELIRRLRKTGISKEQVIEAFEQLERFDAEMGVGKGPSSSSLPRLGLQYSNPNCSVSSSCSFDNPVTSVCEGTTSLGNLGITITKVESIPSFSQQQQMTVTSMQNLTSGGLEVIGGQTTTPLGHSSSAGEGRCPSLSPTTSRLPSELTIIPLVPHPSSNAALLDNTISPIHAGSLKPASSSNSIDGVVSLQCMMNPMEFYAEDVSGALEELKKKSEESILGEIRNFVMRYNIKQSMVAEMTKMSQAYVSRFFRGDTTEMSERTKNAFYTWYLTCKSSPWKLAQVCPNSGVKRMVSDSGDLIPLKRERFTFKAVHLAILEKYYEKDPYPDNDTRENIMQECNTAVSIGKERFLSEREKLTPSVVSNWFNNRRKEAKKLMRQQHAAAMSSVNNNPSHMPYPSNSAGGGGGAWAAYANSHQQPTLLQSLPHQENSSAELLQQHLSAMNSSSVGGGLRGGRGTVSENEEDPDDCSPELDLSCEVDSELSEEDSQGQFDANNLMVMELHEGTLKLADIKTET